MTFSRSRKIIQRITAVFLVLITVVLCMPLQANSAPYETNSDYTSGIFYQRLANVALTGNHRVDLVNVALSQVGYCESDYESQLSGIVQGNLGFTEYGKWYGYHNMWCAMFVSWCAYVANISTDIIPKHAFTPNGLFFFLSNEQTYTRSSVVSGEYTPQLGDLVYYKSDRNENSVNHVGIIIGYSSGYLYTVEGNTNDSTNYTDGGTVMVRSRHISDTAIRYICCPNYPKDDNAYPSPRLPEDSPAALPNPSEGTGKVPNSSVGLTPTPPISSDSSTSEHLHRVN